MSKKLTSGINPDRLDQIIKDLGVRVRLYHSTVCPNITSLETLDHDINCKICRNNMVDFDPKETTALFQQQDLIDQFKLQGTFHLDEALVTFLSGDTLQRYTRVDVLDFEDDFFELIQRQESTDTDKLKYEACTVLGAFSVENSVRTRYYFGTDFELDVNGSIKWISTHKPADRKIYSVYYRHVPIFRAIKAVHRDRFSQYNLRPEKIQTPKIQKDGVTYVRLQETWILKRDYLTKREDKEGNIMSENQLYNPND